MNRIFVVRNLVAGLLFCLGLLQPGSASPEEPKQSPKQAAIEIMIFRVDLAAGNKLGLTWGKQEEMKQKSVDAIESWLEKQGQVILLSGRSFYAMDGKPTNINYSANQPVTRETMGNAKNYEYRDTGSTINVIPTISDKTIELIVSLSLTFLRRQSNLPDATQRYSLNTQLSISDGKTLVIDDVMLISQEEAPRTAIVTLITPHIVK